MTQIKDETGYRCHKHNFISMESECFICRKERLALEKKIQELVKWYEDEGIYKHGGKVEFTNRLIGII